MKGIRIRITDLKLFGLSVVVVVKRNNENNVKMEVEVSVMD